MWDERYSSAGYAYGTAPNDFLRQHLAWLPQGRTLSLAEGEGRNAVFLAQQGHQVTAVDASPVGLAKAERLAQAHGVSLACVVADLAQFEPGQAQWDAVVSVFCPLPRAVRAVVHRRVVAALKPGGVFLLEAYRPEQLAYGTGGGNNPDTMPTLAQLAEELDGLEWLLLQATEREVIEGQYHTGRAAVVQAIGRKPWTHSGVPA